MPSCADSLMSSSTGAPSAPTPIGTRSRSRLGAGRPALRRRRTRPGRRRRAGRPGPCSAASGASARRAGRRRSRSGASRRASASASAAAEPVGARRRRRLACPIVYVSSCPPRPPARAPAAAVEQPRRPAVEVEHGHAVDAAVGRELAGAGEVGAVEHDDHVRPVGARRRPGRTGAGWRARRRAAAPARRPRSRPAAPGRARRPGRGGGRAAATSPSPTRPAGPARRRPRPAGRRARGTSRAGRRIGPDQRARVGRCVAAHVHPGEAAQRQRDRQVGHHRVRVEEPAQRAGRHRLQVLQRPGHRRDERGGQRLRADRDPDDAEVGSVGRRSHSRWLSTVDHSGPGSGCR